jgi:hypothetical protein
MEAKLLLKRVAIDLSIVLSLVLLAAGFPWLRLGRDRAKLDKEIQEIAQDEQARWQGLDSLGNFDLQPDGLTRAKLGELLHQPALAQAGSGGSTKLGWACGKKQCALWVSFLFEPSREIPQSTSPAAMLLTSPLTGHLTNRAAIGGVYLGEPLAEMKDHCKKPGYGVEAGLQQITWDRDWSLVWGEMNGKISMLIFKNEV